MSNFSISGAGGAMPADGRKTRRAALALFAIPAFAVLPASSADPVFAAIERHRAQWSAYVEATHRLSMAELDAFQGANVDADAALEAFLETPPRSLAGMRAALAHAVAFDRGCVPEIGGRLGATLLRSPLFAA